MSDRLFVATRKGLFDLVRKGAGAWQITRTSFLGSPVSMVLRDARDATLYAALDLGHFGVKLHRSSDEGASWEEVSAPSYAGLDPDAEDKLAPSLKLIWAIEPGPADQAGVLWAGTIPGGLFKSTDRGASWTLNHSLWSMPERKQWMGGGYDSPGIHSICLDPRTPHHIVVGVSTGGVWQSFDGGESWAAAANGLRADYVPPEQAGEAVFQDVHRIVACAGAPDCYWIQHHNGVFRCVDGLKSWSEIKVSPSSFGFAVAVHPAKPEVAWFAPAVKDEFRYPVDGKFVVARTSDGGKSFEPLTSGLPQGNAYDLVYRHGLVVDETGARLAMGSTTGHLWISETGGDEWSEIAGHLPPVYALRWA